MEAFYEPLGDDRFNSLPATAGPWDARSQHAGPPCALVVRAMRTLAPARPELRLARVTVDILAPVPVGEVRVQARVARPGRRVELLEGTLAAGGREVLRVTAWRVAAAPGTAPAVADPGTPPDLPPAGPAMDWPGAHLGGILSAVEWRFVAGRPDRPGPATVWARPRFDLVAGVPTDGLERLLILTDSGHGISAELSIDQWLFINTDLTVAVHRHPAGEWICLSARTAIDPDGIGVTETVLADRDGRIGRCLQTLLVAPRPPA